jgi:hypothetical protein
MAGEWQAQADLFRDGTIRRGLGEQKQIELGNHGIKALTMPDELR